MLQNVLMSIRFSEQHPTVEDVLLSEIYPILHLIFICMLGFKGNSTGFDGLVTCCLQANLPGLQERLVSSQSASQGTGDSKPLIGHCDEYGRNLLCLAVHGGSVKCCDYLVACGCEVDSPDTEGMSNCSSYTK